MSSSQDLLALTMNYYDNFQESMMSEVEDPILTYIAPRRISIALIGTGGVGKTAFLEKLNTNRFTTIYNASTGVNRVTIDYGFYVYDFYDHSGQEMYCPPMRNFSIDNTDGIVLMVDCSSRLSYINGKKWLRELLSRKNKPYLMVINKCDIQGDLRIPNNVFENNLKISTKTSDGIEGFLEKVNETM
jgi:small GTP-binding protein